MTRRWKIFTISLVVNFVADQLTKWWAKATLPTNEQGWGVPKVLIENFWEWQLAFNGGSAFGLFQGIGGARIFLSVIGVAALAYVFYMVRAAGEKQTRLLVGLGMVAGGALGNIVDRVLNGSVTDFVVWKYYEHAWPTFNVADVSLVVGVGILLLDLKNSPAAGQDEAEDESPQPKTAKSTTKTKKRSKKR